MEFLCAPLVYSRAEDDDTTIIAVMVGEEGSTNWRLVPLSTEWVETSNEESVRLFDIDNAYRYVLADVNKLRHQLDYCRIEGEHKKVPIRDLLNRERVSRLLDPYNSALKISEPYEIIADTLEDAAREACMALYEPKACTANQLQRTEALFQFKKSIYGSSMAYDPVLLADVFRENCDLASYSERNFKETRLLVWYWPFASSYSAHLSERTKAWAWVIKILRDKGGYLITDDYRTTRLDKDTEILIIYDNPAYDSSEDLLQEAQGIFDQLAVDSMPVAALSNDQNSRQ